MHMKNFLRSTFVSLILFPCICIAQQWPTAPVSISTPGENASSQQVGLDLNGNIVAVWIENGVVKSGSGTIAGGWNLNIDTLSGTGASSPQVVMDSNGNATSIWVENGIIKAATKPLNGSWQSNPNTLSGSSASLPVLSVDTSGNLVAVWLESGFIKSATKLINGSWPVSPDVISNSGASNPQVAIGSDGTVMAVWQGLVSSTPTIYAVSKPIAGSWGSSAVISSASVNSCYPKIAVDASGKAVAIWFRYNLTGSVYSNVVVQSSAKPSGGSWSTPVDISAAGIRNPADLVSYVVSNVSGIAFAAWTNSYNGALFDCEWNLFTNGSWQSTAQVIQPPNLLAFALHVAMDSSGDAYIGWMNYDGSSSSSIIQGSINDTSSFGSGFFNLWTLSTGNSNAYPFGAVSLNGTNINIVGTWVNFNGANNNIQAVTGAFSKIYPPSNPSVMAQVNNFGVVSEISNVLSWQASASSNISSYLIFRNGVYLGWVDPSNLQYVDPNRTVGETVVYGVAAVDSQGCQSSTVTISFTN
ncbi:MAG: hypothetical protein JSS60_09735 [Verrucomicrobia bacterium]|nr:hypothetical protein [Verrucomicrobiota bacterium]